MNILQLIGGGGYYGAENVVVSLAGSLERKNCRSAIGAFRHPARPNEDLVHHAAKNDVAVHEINCRGRWDWQAVTAIRSILESLHVDLLHTHGYKADVYGYLAARTIGIPIVATCHLWTRETAAVRLYEYMDSLFLRRFNAVIAVSDEIAAGLERSGIGEAKIRVIDNGIDVPTFSKAQLTRHASLGEKNRFVVGTVGRLVPQKGMAYFLHAAKEVLKEFPNVVFEIIGDGPDRTKLECLAAGLGIENNVNFRGRCADMPLAYASMDAFVLASIDEGMPMAILEALASNKPVVATRVGAVPRLIVPEVTGLLVAPRDIQGLSQAILRLLKEPRLRSELGIAGEALVTRGHSRELMAKNYAQLYEETAGRFGPRTLGKNSSRKEMFVVS